MKKLFFLLAAFCLASVLFAQTFSNGASVKILWNGAWYSGKVKEVKGDQYKVSYDGWSSEWDEWVSAERVKVAVPESRQIVSKTGIAKGTPARPPVGEYAVYQWNGSNFAYQHRFTLKPNKRYHQFDSDWGNYTYNEKTRIISFTSGPFKGMKGLYYTQGRNNDKKEPVIAIDFNGDTPDPDNAALSQLMYAYFRPGGVK